MRTDVAMRNRAAAEGTDFAQTVALIVGIVYLIVGIVGFFVTGFKGFVSDYDKNIVGFVYFNSRGSGNWVLDQDQKALNVFRTHPDRDDFGFVVR